MVCGVSDTTSEDDAITAEGFDQGRSIRNDDAIT